MITYKNIGRLFRKKVFKINLNINKTLKHIEQNLKFKKHHTKVCLYIVQHGIKMEKDVQDIFLNINFNFVFILCSFSIFCKSDTVHSSYCYIIFKN